MRTRCLETLLANALPWRQRLYKEMRCMPGLKSSLAQALWWITIFANSYLSLEGFIDKFYHLFTNFDRLEVRQLWLNPCHCQLAHKNGSLQASQGHHQRPGPCWSHHQRGSEISRPLRLNCHWPGVVFHLKVLVITMLFPRHQVEAIYCFPPADRWPDREAK